MKIKLPRKRKNKFIKDKGKSDYLGLCIMNEILFEETKQKKDTKFPCYIMDSITNKPKILFNY